MNCLRCAAETTNPKFCSRSCAATYNNTISPKRKPEQRCSICATPINSNYRRCSDCRQSPNDDRLSRIQNWLDGKWNGATKSGNLSITIRDYVVEASNYACSVCGFNERHPSDNRPIIEVNHINGNGMDHRPENLEALCPNHHALTTTYRGRNQGNGRPVFYTRTMR